MTSIPLLKYVWESRMEQFNENTLDHIYKSATALIQHDDKMEYRHWKSSLNEFSDPLQLFETNLQSCSKCKKCWFNNNGFQQFVNNECKCELKISERGSYSDIPDENISKPKSVDKLCGNNSSQETISWGQSQKKFTTKFRPPKVIKNVTLEPKVEPIVIDDVDMEKLEKENQQHKNYVAKITFKTAKEHLVATNLAAKRTLGASRKAQGKFVSPMLTAQVKQVVESEAMVTDDRLKHLDPKMVELIESDIIDKGAPIEWDDIAGLQLAKSAIQEAVVWPLLRPDIFTGLRRPPKGILLFGPPGTGKTLIGKCVAAQCRATFFSISASSLTSKWLGDGEKMVRALFAVAACHQPAVIFIDEIDSVLTQRSESEHEATRRIKTEFLVQFDGAGTQEDDRLLIVGATNRPQELDEAARRRFVKRLYIPLPDADARKQIIVNLLKNENNCLGADSISEIASLTEGYSGADMKALCSEAAMGPVRAVPLSQIVTIDSAEVRPVCLEDFINALKRVRPSVSQDDLGQYVKWNKTYGLGF